MRWLRLNCYLLTFSIKSSIIILFFDDGVCGDMRKKLVRILAVVFVILLTLTACNGGQAADAIDDSVFAAWEGPFSKENRKSAIETYAKKYINVYAVNIEQSNVSVALEFEGVACGSVTLTPVDDSKKDWELNTVVDFSTDIVLDGNQVSIAIDWWYSAPDATRQYKVWSYLFWVKDAEGVQHYYYFRVDYTQ